MREKGKADFDNFWWKGETLKENITSEGSMPEENLYSGR